MPMKNRADTQTEETSIGMLYSSPPPGNANLSMVKKVCQLRGFYFMGLIIFCSQDYTRGKKLIKFFHRILFCIMLPLLIFVSHIKI